MALMITNYNTLLILVTCACIYTCFLWYSAYITDRQASHFPSVELLKSETRIIFIIFSDKQQVSLAENNLTYLILMFLIVVY